jgi:hypothetical protein
VLTNVFISAHKNEYITVVTYVFISAHKNAYITVVTLALTAALSFAVGLGQAVVHEIQCGVYDT